MTSNVSGACPHSRQEGAALVLVMAASLVLSLLVGFVLQQGHAEARANRFELEAARALYTSYAEIEKAKYIVQRSTYAGGRNEVLEAAVSAADRRIVGTRVTVASLGENWYRLTVHTPYEGDYERVVSVPVRGVDYFSSYLLFVSDHPAGVSGRPAGDIHSNRSVQFYFAGGVYDWGVTAVEGFEYRSGAAPENTQLNGPTNPSAAPIALDFEADDRMNLAYLAREATADFNLPADRDAKISLYVSGGEQRVRLEVWTRPSTQLVEKQFRIGTDYVNEREEEYTYTETVVVGTEERTREIQVFDHMETVLVEREEPIYEERTRTVSVPIYRDETRTRTVTKSVWVDTTGDSSGGTTVGGDGTVSTGYWTEETVEEEYTVRVLDHYEDREETYMAQVGTETVNEWRDQPVYRTEIETYTVDVTEEVERTGTRTVWDEEPIYETRVVEEKVYPTRLETRDLAAPENGIIFVGGNILSLYGDVSGRMTIATEGTITLSSNVIYRDDEGDTAFLNGDEPALPYEPNPDYDGDATLGLVARSDILYGRSMPNEVELNATMASVAGRVGIEGVSLDDATGDILSYNRPLDIWGNPYSASLSKNSIRRLGGIISAKRPVETVIDGGRIASGFNVGKAVYDKDLLASPPPGFLSLEQPRFFPMTVEN